jgi:hypothetical protein
MTRFGNLRELVVAALPTIEALAPRAAGEGFAIAPVACLDRCDQAPAVEIHGEHGVLVLAPATAASLDEALRELVPQRGSPA